jgi:hypothetical protein
MEILAAKLFMEWLLLVVALVVVQHLLHLLLDLWAVLVAVVVLIALHKERVFLAA